MSQSSHSGRRQDGLIPIGAVLGQWADGLSLPDSGVAFATDDQLAERLRAVETELRDREPASARELAEIAQILDPEAVPVDQAVVRRSCRTSVE
jgi:hypothetical protein